MIKLSGISQIETERLSLRPFKKEDAIFMFKNWGADDKISKYMLWNTNRTVKDVEQVISFWIENYKNNSPTYQYAIILKEINEPIGAFTLDINQKNHRADIAYCIGTRFQKRGFAKECIMAVRDYAFEQLKCIRISAEILKSNTASIKLIKSCGFTQEGVQFKKIYSKRKCFEDLLLFSIINKNYKEIEKELKIT